MQLGTNSQFSHLGALCATGKGNLFFMVCQHIGVIFSQIIIYNFVTICNQIWYQGVPLSCLLVYQISRQSDNAFVFNNNFHNLTKRRKKNKKLSQFSKVHISKIPGTNYAVEIWNVR